MVKKIVFSVLVSFVIAFSILYVSLFLYHNKIENGLITENDQNSISRSQFYSQNFPDEKKIFLVGSSHLDPLNSTFIHDYLKQQGQEYHVYNLAEGADTPSERFKEIDMMISSHPTVVVYGIAARDFEDIHSVDISSFSKPVSYLPDPSFAFHQFLSWLNSYLNLDFLENPQVDTLTSISNFMDKHGMTPRLKYEYVSDPNLPFMTTISKDNYVAKNDEDLKRLRADVWSSNGISSPSNNENVMALKKIIEKLHENHIQVIIFTTPQHRYYLDAIPESEKNSFNEVVNYISEEEKIPIYNFTARYIDLNDWYNLTHLAMNENST
ncbi:MAG: hypothetical protein KGL95_00885, partial [Patescibacteria group bacterium]|nr:hypothetical protein [Patescibacteria group bacterium]